jgi:hypothetical protein
MAELRLFLLVTVDLSCHVSGYRTWGKCLGSRIGTFSVYLRFILLGTSYSSEGFTFIPFRDYVG